MKFNINDKVRIRLTDIGRKTLVALRTKDNEVIAKMWAGSDPPLLPLTQPEVDGWSEWLLWEVMATFGASITMAGPPLFETEIDLLGQVQG